MQPMPNLNTPLDEFPILSLDLETTGLDVVNDRIVQIGAFSMQGVRRESLPVLDCLINPGVPIPAASTRIHGITDADVADSVAFNEIVSDLVNALEGRVVIGHHIEFDLAVLRHEAARAQLDWRDPPCLDLAMLAAALAPELPDHGMESVASWLGITVKGRHTAIGDSLAAADIFARLLPLLHERDVRSLEAATALVATRDDMIVQAHRAGWHSRPTRAQSPRDSSSQQQLQNFAEVKNAQARDAQQRLDDGESAVDVQTHISAVNIDLHRGVLELCLREVAAEGHGEPPVEFDALIIGSGSRFESLLHPDQDNGFLLADVAASNVRAVDRWFEALATKMTEALATVGFYKCPGWVMATNPRWRKTLEGFKQQTIEWIESAEGDDLHYCNIFLDFRSFYGPGDLTTTLHNLVSDRARDRRFLARLYDIHKHHTGALGWFGRLITDPNPGPNQGKIDLKTAGTLPIVTAVRLLALHHGIRAHSTRDRIAALDSAGYLNEASDVLSAYSHIVFLLLRQQIKDRLADAPVGNHVPPDTFNRDERIRLVDTYKVIRRFCTRVRNTI